MTKTITYDRADKTLAVLYRIYCDKGMYRTAREFNHMRAGLIAVMEQPPVNALIFGVFVRMIIIGAQNETDRHRGD